MHIACRNIGIALKKRSMHIMIQKMEASSPNEKTWSNTFHGTLGVKTEKKKTNAKHTMGCAFSSSSTFKTLHSKKSNSNMAVPPPRQRVMMQTMMMQPQTPTPQCRQQSDATTSQKRGMGGHGATRWRWQWRWMWIGQGRGQGWGQ
jgi:hypothetical protein